MSGKAEFVEVRQDHKVRIEEVRVNLEAEELNAQVKIEHTKGTAEIIKIENGSIIPAYIQYLRVCQQSNLSDKTVMYIPTKTNLPVLKVVRDE